MTTTNEKKLTRGEKVNADITALLKARHTLLWVVSREEVRVERALVEASSAAKYETMFWDCASGITSSTGNKVEQAQDPQAALDFFEGRKQKLVLVMRDLHKWVSDPVTQRKLRNLVKKLQAANPNDARTIVVLTTSADVPPELAGHATVIDYPLPDRAEVAKILDDVISALPEDLKAKAAPNGTRDAAIDAAVGLTSEEAANCYARSLVTSRRIDPQLVSAEKRRVIAREKVLTWYEPNAGGMSAVGGLDVLKVWLSARKSAFTARARAFGLPAPKGALLVGVPGCGKSLTAKCVASAWGMPLLRLDMGALRSKYVGESEANIRKALQVAEAVSPCVLWLDEIEKALGGSTGPQGDGGVSADALGAVLSWMQERQGSVFVIATANDVSSLPPELLRKGRFDEVFFIDLPTQVEREAILSAALVEYGRAADAIAVTEVANMTQGFTGAELAALIPDALFSAFDDGERALAVADVKRVASATVPLSKTASEKIGALREWAKSRARGASTPEAESKRTARALDIDEN